ncbi:hypothetical protein CHS0354_012872 [Potamilus streckersoni]|uniref:THAP-type domain-containing protein n=1 Tax=Potamilus streckersoni TaxID=2493646 RepID=A0AAE0SWB1_9BIVA|nr:hypothetical protein CHS0354_012872 [Potamilus streckersoni]
MATPVTYTSFMHRKLFCIDRRGSSKHCNGQQQKGCKIKLFRIPKEELLRNQWIAAIRRENWLPTDHTRIRCKHFIVSKLDASHYASGQVECHHQRLVEREHTKKKTLAFAAEAMMCLNTDAVDENSVPGTSTQTEVCDSSTQTDTDVSLLQGILATNGHFKAQLDTLQKEKDVLLNDVVHELNKVQYKNVELKNKLEDPDGKYAILMESLKQKSI